MNITPREKRGHRVSPFLAWVDFHARSRFARSTIPEEKWGTTRSLERSPIAKKIWLRKLLTTNAYRVCSQGIFGLMARGIIIKYFLLVIFVLFCFFLGGGGTQKLV